MLNRMTPYCWFMYDKSTLYCRRLLSQWKLHSPIKSGLHSRRPKPWLAADNYGSSILGNLQKESKVSCELCGLWIPFQLNKTEPKTMRSMSQVESETSKPAGKLK